MADPTSKRYPTQQQPLEQPSSSKGTNAHHPHPREEKIDTDGGTSSSPPRLEIVEDGDFDLGAADREGIMVEGGSGNTHEPTEAKVGLSAKKRRAQPKKLSPSHDSAGKPPKPSSSKSRSSTKNAKKAAVSALPPLEEEGSDASAHETSSSDETLEPPRKSRKIHGRIQAGKPNKAAIGGGGAEKSEDGFVPPTSTNEENPAETPMEASVGRKRKARPPPLNTLGEFLKQNRVGLLGMDEKRSMFLRNLSVPIEQLKEALSNLPPGANSAVLLRLMSAAGKTTLTVYGATQGRDLAIRLAAGHEVVALASKLEDGFLGEGDENSDEETILQALEKTFGKSYFRVGKKLHAQVTKCLKEFTPSDADRAKLEGNGAGYVVGCDMKLATLSLVSFKDNTHCLVGDFLCDNPRILKVPVCLRSRLSVPTAASAASVPSYTSGGYPYFKKTAAHFQYAQQGAY